jgi:hypothetical protein
MRLNIVSNNNDVGRVCRTERKASWRAQTHTQDKQLCSIIRALAGETIDSGSAILDTIAREYALFAACRLSLSDEHHINADGGLATFAIRCRARSERAR